MNTFNIWFYITNKIYMYMYIHTYTCTHKQNYMKLNYANAKLPLFIWKVRSINNNACAILHINIDPPPKKKIFFLRFHISFFTWYPFLRVPLSSDRMKGKKRGPREVVIWTSVSRAVFRISTARDFRKLHTFNRILSKSF